MGEKSELLSNAEDERERHYQQTLEIMHLYSEALKRGDERAQARCLQLLGQIKIWETEEYVHRRLTRIADKLRKEN